MLCNKQYITVDNSSILLYTVCRRKTYILRRGGGEYKEKKCDLDTCYTAISIQRTYLNGVLDTAYNLKLISQDEYSELREQIFNKVLNRKDVEL